MSAHERTRALQLAGRPPPQTRRLRLFWSLLLFSLMASDSTEGDLTLHCRYPSKRSVWREDNENHRHPTRRLRRQFLNFPSNHMQQSMQLCVWVWWKLLLTHCSSHIAAGLIGPFPSCSAPLSPRNVLNQWGVAWPETHFPLFPTPL